MSPNRVLSPRFVRNAIKEPSGDQAGSAPTSAARRASPVPACRRTRSATAPPTVFIRFSRYRCAAAEQPPPGRKLRAFAESARRRGEVLGSERHQLARLELLQRPAG